MEWKKNRDREQTAWMPELCRLKLIGYADSLRELSKSYCPQLQEANGQEQSRKSLLAEYKIHENREIMGENLNALAQAMVRIAEEMGACRPIEEKKRRLLSQTLKAEGFCVKNLYYLQSEGSRRTIGMTLSTEKSGGREAEEVADILSVLFHRQFKLSVTSPSRADRTDKWFVFVEEAFYMALTGLARATKEGEEMSGDHYAVVESEQGRLSLILSDGTGSGEKASAESGRVLDLLEKMMEAGYDTSTAVHMVNAAFFAMEEEENHPTLDICELNLYEGSCDIFKMGAAATFIKRGECVEQIAMDNLPLGILGRTETARVHRELNSGDFLIMMTDGVLDALAEAEMPANEQENLLWQKERELSGETKEPEETDDAGAEVMRELISMIKEQNPEEIAEKLLQMALCSCGGRIRDDMTVLVAGIWENHRLA